MEAEVFALNKAFALSERDAGYSVWIHLVETGNDTGGNIDIPVVVPQIIANYKQ